MDVTISKVAALVIALCCSVSVMAFTTQPWIALFLLGPLALIWFPETIGSYTGYVSSGQTIDTETPPSIVAGLGWLLLVLMGCSIIAVLLGHQ